MSKFFDLAVRFWERMQVSVQVALLLTSGAVIVDPSLRNTGLRYVVYTLSCIYCVGSFWDLKRRGFLGKTLPQIHSDIGQKLRDGNYQRASRLDALAGILGAIAVTLLV